MDRRPRLIVVAGPNGVGKSTYSRTAFASGFLLLDPDRYGIERGDAAPITAGRRVVDRVHIALAAGESIVLETTLSGRFPLKVLQSARQSGYDVDLLYIGVSDVDECLRRVRMRVAAGGHDVPEADVRRRFTRSLAALPGAIQLASNVTIHDNAAARPYRLIARRDATGTRVAPDVPAWVTAAIDALRSPNR